MGATGDERQEQGIPHDAKASSPVIDRLFKAGYRFDFFQAVHLLEQLYPDAARPGEDQPLSQEPIRFQSSHKRLILKTTDTTVEDIITKYLESASIDEHYGPRPQGWLAKSGQEMLDKRQA